VNVARRKPRENMKVGSTPCEKRFGKLVGSSGSDPNSASNASGNPSLSLSAFELGSMMIKLLLTVENVSEFPIALAATVVNVPTAVALMARLSVAEVPEGSISAEVTVRAGGENTGTNENVEPLRLKPVTRKLERVLLDSAEIGLTKVITGSGMAAKFVADDTVAPATVTETDLKWR